MTDDEYGEIREAFILAMRAEGINEATIHSVIVTVDDAVDNM